MKLILVGMFLLGSVASANEVCQPQAQFTGKAYNVDAATCTYSVRVETHSPNELCPLAYEAIQAERFTDCSVKEDGFVEGLAVSNNGKITLEP